jgi:hypothetical protein
MRMGASKHARWAGATPRRLRLALIRVQARAMRTILVLTITAALLAACKKSDDKKPEPAPATTAPKAGEPPATPATDPAKPADPAAPADPAKPADPAAAPAVPAPSAGPRPASVTDAHVAIADKLVVLMEEFGKALEVAGTDCKAATAAAKAFADRFKAIKADADKVKGVTESDPAAEEWFKTNYMTKLMGAMGPMMKTAQACATDKEFMATLQAMDVPGKKVKKAGP